MESMEEVEDWEVLHPNPDEDDSMVLGAPPLHSLRSDHFSLHPQNLNPISNSNSNSNSSSEVDRNFDDSYVANQLFPNPTLTPWIGDSDSDSSTSTSTATATSTTVLMPETDPVAALEVEEEEEEHNIEQVQEDKRLAWWKVPFQVLRYWVNPLHLPVWSLSVAAAAALLGLYFLRRSFYRMKRKTQTLKLNLALDDKKVSQLMGRVARLNEAFSVVRRVPIVRPPPLPASSVTLRPVMSMR